MVTMATYIFHRLTCTCIAGKVKIGIFGIQFYRNAYLVALFVSFVFFLQIAIFDWLQGRRVNFRKNVKKSS